MVLSVVLFSRATRSRSCIRLPPLGPYLELHDEAPPTIAGALLGLMFVAFGLMFLLGFVPEQPPPPEGSPMALFMGAFAPTGYLTFVKVLEVLGGALVAVPRTRNLGLLVLGPIIVNILAFHIFIAGGEGLFEPVLLAICALAAFLLWSERRAFGKLVAAER